MRRIRVTTNNVIKTIEIKINKIPIIVPDYVTILQACEKLSLSIPRFCFHESLAIAGNCRACFVEVKGSPKPVVSCSMPVQKGMEIFTDSALVKKAREGVLEFLLVNHPLDCPICDQGGECDLQDQALAFGSERSRFFESKRPVNDKFFGGFIKTIMTRCIHCTRCVRFAENVSGIDHLGVVGRGTGTEISFYVPGKSAFNSEFSGNVIDLCPVGALTSKPYAFIARPWDTIKHPTYDLLDSSLTPIIISTVGGKVVRVLPQVNSQTKNNWISDKTRFFFDSLSTQLVLSPLFKTQGAFEKISWEKAFFVLSYEMASKSPTRNKFITGDAINLESMRTLKNLLTFNGMKVANQNDFNLTTDGETPDYSTDLIASPNFSEFDGIDLCLFIDFDPRKELAVYNLNLKEYLQKKNVEVYTVGAAQQSLYKQESIGLNAKSLIKIATGTHSFCKNLIKSKKTLVLIGAKFVAINEVKTVLELLKKNANVLINTIHSNVSTLNFKEVLEAKKKRIGKTNLHLACFYNTAKLLNVGTSSMKCSLAYAYKKEFKSVNLLIPTTIPYTGKGSFMSAFGLIKTQPEIKFKSVQNRIDGDSAMFEAFTVYYSHYFCNYKNTKKTNLWMPIDSIICTQLPQKSPQNRILNFTNYYTFLHHNIANFFGTNLLELNSRELTKASQRANNKPNLPINANS